MLLNCGVTGDQWRNNSRKNEETETKQKQHPVTDVTGDRSKIQCYKEQYCIGTWNVRSMNQGKLEVVKQEMAKVNVDILGNSKLKWTGMGEFNSDDHYIYYCGQEGNGTPLQYFCLENPVDGGAWWAAVHGVVESQTRLSDFTFTFHWITVILNGLPWKRTEIIPSFLRFHPHFRLFC